MSRVWLACALALTLLGCGAEETAPASEPADPPAETEATGEPEAETEAQDDAPPSIEEQVPVEEDFETASAREITLDNYEAELDRIDRDLCADGVDTGSHAH